MSQNLTSKLSGFEILNEVDVGDISKVVGCKMFTRKLVRMDSRAPSDSVRVKISFL